MARLKEKATNCNFGDLYDRMVKDRFIYGLKNEKMRSQLLNKQDLDTAAKVLVEVIRREAMNAANLPMSSSVNSVHMRTPGRSNFQPKHNKQNFNKNSTKPGTGSGGNQTSYHYQSSNRNGGLTCSKCTLRGHSAKDCKTRCRYCKGVGHIKVNCYKRNKTHNVDDVTSQQQDYEVLEEEEQLYMFYVDVPSSTYVSDSYVSDDKSSCSVMRTLHSCVSPVSAVLASNSHEKSSSEFSGMCASNSHEKSSSNVLDECADTNDVSFVQVKCVSDAGSLTTVNDQSFSKINSVSKTLDRKPNRIQEYTV